MSDRTDQHGIQREGEAACDATKSRVLLALAEVAHSSSSLLRARELAQLLGAELHVLRVLPEFGAFVPPFDPDALVQSLESLEIELISAHATEHWLMGVLGDPNAADRLEIRSGSFVQLAAAHASRIGATLIIIPPQWRFGTMIAALAHAAGMPVLVLRDKLSGHAIVAATDLRDSKLPVLHKAAEFGVQLDARVIPFHNVSPMPMLVSADSGWPIVTDLDGRPEATARERRLTFASSRLRAVSPAVVASEVNPVDGILRTARSRGADLVVVGVRQRSWFGRILKSSVAAQVVNRARQSVLVMPLTSPAGGGIAPFSGG